MKLYTLDHNVYGASVVVANSKEEAYTKFILEHPCTSSVDKDRIVEHEINENFVFTNLGDL